MSSKLLYITGWTPLHAASSANQNDFVVFLLEVGADPNAEMETGWTPLHAAVKNNNRVVQNAFMQNGANWNVLAHHR